MKWKRFLFFGCAGLFLCSVVWLTSSCTASRTVTTSASYVTRGDTTTTIVTKTIETYQGKKEGVL